MSSIAYTVNDKGEVWTLHEQGGGDLLSPANQDFAQDIGVNTDGTAWVISTEARPGGAVPQWSDNSEPHKWTALAPPAAAVRIAVAKDGTAYTVNTKGEVWTLHQQGGGRLLSPSGQDFAQDIGVGADGTVWIISTEDRPGGCAPKWLKDPETGEWQTVDAPSAAIRIAVGPEGTAYTVNDKGEVWTVAKQGGGALLSPVAGEDFAQDIGVGADGTVWVVSTEARPGGAVPKWLAETKDPKWVSLAAPAAAAQIAVR